MNASFRASIPTDQLPAASAHTKPPGRSLLQANRWRGGLRGLALLAAVGISLFAVPSRAGDGFEFEVLAKTGPALPTIQGPPSIDDEGKVAFVGNDASGNGIWIADKGAPKKITPALPGITIHPAIKMNNRGQVVSRTLTEGKTWVALWDATRRNALSIVRQAAVHDYTYCSGGMLVGKDCSSLFDCPGFFGPNGFILGPPFWPCGHVDRSPYSGLSFPTLNDSGTFAYYGLVPGRTVTNFLCVWSNNVERVLKLNLTQIKAPMLANNGKVVANHGSLAGREPIMLYSSDSLDRGFIVAGSSNGFASVGVLPGINDSGSYVAFWGDLTDTNWAAQFRTTTGPGIFVFDIGKASLVRAIGIESPTTNEMARITGLSNNDRVSINDSGYIAFLGSDADGRKTIFVSQVDLQTGQTRAADIRAVVTVGDTFTNLTGVVSDVALWDGLNNRNKSGDVAFLVTMADGTNSYKAVLRANEGCSACRCRAGQCDLALGSVDLKIGLGSPAGSSRSSFLRLHASTPSANLASPSSLALSSASGVASVRANGALRQIRNGSIIADIETETPYRYTVRFFTRYSLPDPVTRLSIPSGTPFSIVTVENPDAAAASNRLRITQNGLEQGTYQYNAALAQWELITGFGNAARMECITQSTNDGIRVMTRVITKARTGAGGAGNPADGEVLSRAVSRYQSFPWGEELIETREGPEPAKVTRFSYYADSSEDSNYGRLRSVVYPTGRWEFYKEYNSAGSLVKSVSQFQNNPYSETTNWPDADNRSFEISAGDGLEMRTEYLQGHAISRRWHAERRGDESLEVVASRPEVMDINDPSNLVTRQFKYAETTSTGSKAGETSRVIHSDGTMTLYAYYSERVVDPAHSEGPAVEVNRSVTWTGAPNAAFTAITNGVSTEDITDLAGNLFSRREWDVASGVLTASETVTGRDEFGRATRTDYLGGTYTTRTYNCCGLANETDREGVTTTYNSDNIVSLDLDRDGSPETYYGSSVTRAGLTTHTLTDPLGRAFKTILQGTNGSLIVQDERHYNVSGELEWSKDAMGRQTTYAESTANGFTVRTTTFPDGSQSIGSTYQDGSAYETRGNAVQGMRSSQEMVQDTGVWVQKSTQTRLESDGSLSPEYTATYTDFAGRAYKTEYPWPDGPGPVFAFREYNTRGQLARSSDPDGLTTLYAYNRRGELETTALDLANRGVMDFVGDDRITRTASSVENSALRGSVVRRTVTELWETNGVNQSTVLQTSEVSADGAQTWTTQYGLTTHTATILDRSNQRRTVTTENPDHTSTVTVFEQGRQKSVTRLDKNGARVTQTTFAYDPFGRLQTQTDARNGPTTYTYYDDGQLHTVTTPDPDPAASGPGLDPQTTTYTYYRDPANGIKTVTTLPDGGVVAQEYFPGGQLKKTWGARTYPAEYTYDRAGRMKTLKTWQQFNFATGTGIAGDAVTTWNYNARGLLANKRYADNKGPSYTYTAGGKLKTRLWARGVLTTYGYDAQTGDLLTTTYSDATPAVTNTYARSGQLQSVTDASGLRTFGYRHGQTATEAYGPGLFAGFTLVRDYDELNRQSALSVTSPTGAIYHVTYGYDAASRLYAVTSGVDVATYAYHPDSDLVQTLTQAHSNAVRLTTTKLYDKLGRLLSITSVPSADSPISFDYQYNDANQRTRATLANGEYWTYGYDALGQVTNGVKRFPNGAPIPGYSFGYKFDQIGNRQSAMRDGTTDSYTNNALNQIAGINYSPWLHVLGAVSNNATITVNGHNSVRSNGYFYAQLAATNTWNTVSVQARAVGQATNGTGALAEETGHLFQPTNAVSLQYDDDGNLLSDGRWSMTWDAENRVIKKESLPTIPQTAERRLEYAFDSIGRRVLVKLSGRTTGTWQLVSSRSYMANKLELLTEMDAAAPDNMVQSYTWGLDLSGTRSRAGGIGGLLMLESKTAQPTEVHVIAFDANGNVQSLVAASSGSVSAQYDYDPFGNTVRLSGSAAGLNSMRFSTKLAEVESGDVHYELRDYCPRLGRWLNPDPLSETGGLNITGFAHNDSVNRYDLFGLFVEANRVVNNLHEVVLDMRIAIEAFARSQGKKSCCELKSSDWGRLGGKLTEHFAQYRSRFFWTRSGGWVDMRHMLAAAFAANNAFYPSVAVEYGGKLTEQAQARAGNASAFSVEDLPSNHYGILFEPSIDENKLCDLPDVFESFVQNRLGGFSMPPMFRILNYNLTRNFSDDPIMDPFGPDIIVDQSTGIPYKSGGNPSYERTWLDIMHSHGISGSSVGVYR